MILRAVACLIFGFFSASALGAGAENIGADPPLVLQCKAAGNNDTVHGYDPALRVRLLAAYRRLFPHAATPPQSVLEAETNIRCMNHRLLVCFTGANLPCGKLNQSRANTGADTFCHTNPNAAVVPMFASGHDTIYAYRCVSGLAEITSRTWEQIDQRGFARQLWTPLSSP